MLKHRHIAKKNNQRGQAMVEFIIMFPIILGFIWYLLKVQLAINTSIVGQQNARSQVFLKVLNHRDYPVENEYKNYSGKRSAYWLGVAGNPVDPSSPTTQPAPVVNLGIGLKPTALPGSRDDVGEPDTSMMRQNVRIRTAFGICTSRKPFPNGTYGDYCGEVDK